MWTTREIGQVLQANHSNDAGVALDETGGDIAVVELGGKPERKASGADKKTQSDKTGLASTRTSMMMTA